MAKVERCKDCRRFKDDPHHVRVCLPVGPKSEPPMLVRARRDEDEGYEATIVIMTKLARDKIDIRFYRGGSLPAPGVLEILSQATAGVREEMD